MRRIVLSSLVAIALAAGAITLSADSRPVLTGGAAGIELCSQAICGFALFLGQFQGEVNSKPASGGFVATVRHENLPPVGLTADVLGGQWTITAGRRVFSGDITGGTILNVNGTQYCVKMVLDIDAGGRIAGSPAIPADDRRVRDAGREPASLPGVLGGASPEP